MSFAKLNYPDGSYKVVWLLDANIPYFQGKHIPLFVVATVTAVVGLTFTVVLFCWQLMQFIDDKCPKKLIILRWMTNSKLLAFIDAYHAPFNKQHRYWIGMLLILRTLLYLVSAVNVLGDPRINLVSIICVMVFLFTVYAALVQKPLRIYVLNLMDLAHFVNLFIFTALTFYLKEVRGNQTVLAYSSISIAVILFSITVVYHTYAHVFQRRKKKLVRIWRTFCIQNIQQTRGRLSSDTVELPNVVVDLSDQSSEVTVTEINALPNIDSTDSDEDEEYSSSQSTLLSVEQGNEDFQFMTY